MRLTGKHDAYGAEILAFLEGSRMPEIVERDDGYIDISSGAAHYFAPFKAWPIHERKGMKFVRGRVLDIGCGAGRVIHHLENRGHEVLGIDNSSGAIRACRKVGIKNTRVMSITEIGPQLGLFDTIVMYGNNFGLFGSFTRARWLLKKMHRMTSNKGRIVAVATDPYASRLPEHVAYRKWNKSRGRMGGQLRIRIRFKKYVSPYFDYLFVSPTELDQILEGTNWSVTKLIRSNWAQYVAVIDKI